jgi:hypothetical protein
MIRETHGMANTRLHQTWRGMKNRCFNVKFNYYSDYGGRGITVCDEWKNSFIAFKNWAMNNGYSDNLEINRINNNDSYSPQNCDFVSRYINTQNTRKKVTNNSGYTGVIKVNSKWRAVIDSFGKHFHLGVFPTPEDAAKARNSWIVLNKTYHTLSSIPSSV